MHTPSRAGKSGGSHTDQTKNVLEIKQIVTNLKKRQNSVNKNIPFYFQMFNVSVTPVSRQHENGQNTV